VVLEEPQLPSSTNYQEKHHHVVACVGLLCVCMCSRTLLSAVALAGASSSLHNWSIRAVGPALDEHDLVKALTGAHCMEVHAR
jgi:hypothetical protein